MMNYEIFFSKIKYLFAVKWQSWNAMTSFPADPFEEVAQNSKTINHYEDLGSAQNL